jgi:hypothetical protein
MEDDSMDILSVRYSTPDAAFATDHGDFGEFRRAIIKGKFQLLPRHVQPGPGAEYRYGHLVEMAIFMSLSVAYSKETAKSVLFYGLRDAMSVAVAKYNAMSPDEQQAIDNYQNFEASEDPMQLSWFVDFPKLTFSEEAFSRDPAKPSFWIFNPVHLRSRGDVRRVSGDLTLSQLHAEVVKMTTNGAMNDDVAAMLASRCDVPGVVNITEIINRLERRMQIRLAGRQLSEG